MYKISEKKYRHFYLESIMFYGPLVQRSAHDKTARLEWE